MSGCSLIPQELLEYMYINRLTSMRELTLYALFVISMHIFYVIGETVRKMAKSGNLKT